MTGLGRGVSKEERKRLALESALGIPFTNGNLIEPLRNGNEIFPPMLEAIAAASEQIEFLTFVYWSGSIAEKFVEALSERARSGVMVRVLLDGFGARPMPKDLVERMRTAGVDVRWFRPLPQWKLWTLDNRTHRKVLVCDGLIGFTGGVGVAAEWEGDAENPEHWRDSHFRCTGPCVTSLRAAFYQNWVEADFRVSCAVEKLYQPAATGEHMVQVIASTGSVGLTDVAILHEALILLSEHRLRIVTPYFSPHERTVETLIDAAGRGVEIEIMLPGPHIDKRVSELAASESFQPLLEAGVTIWRYQPTMIHKKLLTVDQELSCIGSANFNQRSISKDDEILLCVLDRDFTRRMDEEFETDRDRCRPVKLGEWKRRGPGRRLIEGMAGLFKGQS